MRYFGMSVDFWTGIQVHYNTEIAKMKIGDRLETEVKIFKSAGAEIFIMNENKKEPKGAGKSSFELINSDILTDILTDMLPAKPGSVVLDLACGKGIYSLFLSEVVGESGLVYAVDLWKEGIELLGKYE